MAKRQEELWMSRKDRDRLKVLHEVRKRHITQVQAGKELAIGMTMGQRWPRKNSPSTDSRWGKRRCESGCCRPDCGRRGGPGGSARTCGAGDERAGESCCSGTPVRTIGWKDEESRCI